MQGAELPSLPHPSNPSVRSLLSQACSSVCLQFITWPPHTLIHVPICILIHSPSCSFIPQTFLEPTLCGAPNPRASESLRRALSLVLRRGSHAWLKEYKHRHFKTGFKYSSGRQEKGLG